MKFTRAFYTDSCDRLIEFNSAMVETLDSDIELEPKCSYDDVVDYFEYWQSISIGSQGFDLPKDQSFGFVIEIEVCPQIFDLFIIPSMAWDKDEGRWAAKSLLPNYSYLITRQSKQSIHGIEQLLRGAQKMLIRSDRT